MIDEEYLRDFDAHRREEDAVLDRPDATADELRKVAMDARADAVELVHVLDIIRKSGLFLATMVGQQVCPNCHGPISTPNGHWEHCPVAANLEEFIKLPIPGR